MTRTSYLLPKQAEPCNLCKRANFRPLYEINCFDIVKCRNCGLVFVANPPSLDRLQDNYDAGYYAGANEWVYKDYLAGMQLRLAHFRARLAGIHKYFPVPGKLLELGAAYGLFLQVAQDGGWQVKGIELSPISSRYARDTLGFDVLTGDLSQHPLNDVYDLVVGWDVIEHLRDPSGTLKRLNSLLRPNGMVVFSTGNLACLGARIYKGGWHLLTPPWHLYFFTVDTLRKLMSESGLELLNVTYEGNPFYNYPSHGMLDRVLTKILCKSRINPIVVKIASKLRGGLAVTVYGRKVRDLESRIEEDRLDRKELLCK